MKLAEGTWSGLVDSEVALFRQVLGGLSGVGVEIGCLDGFSTAHLLECSQLQLTTIDPFIPDSMAENLIGSEARFHENVAAWRDRVTLRKDYSWNVVSSWNQPLDFLFIDGDHTYSAVMRDYEQWTPFLKPGAILAMHDSRMYRTHDDKRAKFHPGPSQVAMDEVYGKPQKWQLLGETWALTVARKI